MNLTKHGTICLLLVAGLASTGCLERQFAAGESAVSVNTREILVPSDLYDGRDLVKDTLFVTANRSWSVEMVEDVDWVTVDTTGHQDLSKVYETAPVIFSFKDNESEQERSTKVNIWCDGICKQITIRQEAISYRLVLTSSKDGFGSVSSDGQELPISINTNTEWSVKFVSEDGVSVSFSASSGKYSSDFVAKVGENEELITKTGTIIISAKNCKDIEIPVGQLEGTPYFRLTDATSIHMGEGNVYRSGICDYDIPIATNSSWTAQVISVEGFDPLKVSVAPAGTKSDKTAKLTFPYADDFSVAMASIKVRFTAEGVKEPVDFVLSQKPSISIIWYDIASKSMIGAVPDTYPFTSPALSFFPTSASLADKNYVGTENPLEMVLKQNGYVFKAGSTKGYWRNSAQGLMFGGGLGSYLELPVPAGKKLVGMDYRRGGPDKENSSFTAFTFSLQDSAGNIIPEATLGDNITLSNNKLPVTVSLSFPSTSLDVRYRMVASTTSAFCLAYITLYYE